MPCELEDPAGKVKPCRHGPQTPDDSTSEKEKNRENDDRNTEQMTHAVYDLELTHNVVLSMMIVPAEDWEHGVYRVLPIRREIERDGVAA